MTKFAQKGYFRFQKEKWTSSSNSTYSNYSRFQVSSSTDNFVFLAEFAKKKVFLFQNRKSEDDHRIQNIRISLDVKFHRKLTILIVLTKFYPKIKKKIYCKNLLYSKLIQLPWDSFTKKILLKKVAHPFKKETLAQVFFCEFFEISRNTFFTEHLWTTASEWPILYLNI